MVFKKHFLLISFILAVPLCATQAFAEIYVVRGKGGSVTFTNRSPAASSNYKVFKPTRPAYSVFYRRSGKWKIFAKTSSYDAIIRQLAKDNSLEPALLKAVVHAESGFNPRARSYKGAMGLMQLMPATAKRFGVSNAYHPERNVEGGSKYLSFLLQRYKGNERLAVAAYNAGEGAVDPIMTVPPYRETQVYVKRVLKLRELYACVDSGKRGCAKSVYVE